MNASTLLLERLSALIHQSVRSEAARHGLLPMHLQVLSYLDRANQYSDLPIAIAEYFGVTRGTVSQTLTVLERKGLVARDPDAHDRRRVHLRLTPAARNLLADSWTRRVDETLRDLPVESDPLEQNLRALLTGLQRLNGQQAFGVCHTCDHFLREAHGARCGLTGEPLAEEQTFKLCREWTGTTD
ncbi:MarR family winged helix-turn-helix transcriptional regulator [Elongatibacter sediminis]|uniref:MarR family transcriptional regulator n=1 Tax=Elongatibacter sediminis TaxID=3119006 RepID=A0AAW9RI36_9GAMM